MKREGERERGREKELSTNASANVAISSESFLALPALVVTTLSLLIVSYDDTYTRVYTRTHLDRSTAEADRPTLKLNTDSRRTHTLSRRIKDICILMDCAECI